ncbi:MAG TPA: hypothetical protein VK474_11595 [Chthoniobacterales bacterium]|nr:hypothetical protein [Chthoniobacterales bacterium]
MKQTNRLKRTPAASNRTLSTRPEMPATAGFENFAAATPCQVPCQAIHEFLQGIPHRWQLDDIDRFGYRVGRMALSMGLPILRGTNTDIGELRIFPVAFLEWVYSTMAHGCKWPLLGDVEIFSDGRRAQRLELRKRERAAQSLQEISEAADNIEVLTSLQTVQEFLHSDIARRRQEMDAPPAIAEPVGA